MIDLEQATRDALRTDLPDYFPPAERAIEILGIIRSLLYEARQAGSDLDFVKKQVFYGKDQGFSTINTEITPEMELRARGVIRLLHGVIGLLTESAEAAGAVYDYIFLGKPLDRVNIAEESGDLTWYQRLLADELPQPFEETIRLNVQKLKTRYPEKFTAEAAINRNLDAEREVLDGNSK